MLVELRRQELYRADRGRRDARRRRIVGQRQLEVATGALQPERGLALAVAVDRRPELDRAESRLRGAELTQGRGEIDLRPDGEIARPIQRPRAGPVDRAHERF